MGIISLIPSPRPLGRTGEVLFFRDFSWPGCLTNRVSKGRIVLAGEADRQRGWRYLLRAQG